MSETTAKSTVPVGELVPQPHGGAIRNGGTNKGGPGRPASALREALRGSFEERMAVLESIVDGEPVQEISVPLAMILKHAHCPNCGEALKADEAASLFVVNVKGKVSARPGDRIKSLDLMAKYGLGTTQEVSGPDGEAVPIEITVTRRIVGDGEG